MRICIYGAGAIGGYLGAQLSLAGEDVSLIARGPHLEAMRRDGLRLRIGDEERVAHPLCTSDPSEAGTQDYVVVTLKAHSVPGIVDAMQPLLGVRGKRGPLVVFLQARGPVGESSGRERRSRRHTVGAHRPGAGDWLRGVSRV